MKIYTLTLNPAFDLHYTIENFKPYSENYVDESLTQSAGKGINISRALRSEGVDNTAFVIVGGNDFDSYSKNLDIDCKYFVTEGDVRKNITVHTKGMPETMWRDSFKFRMLLLNLLIYSKIALLHLPLIPGALSFLP